MSFVWKCDNCKKEVIVPYESPKVMSAYSIPYCEECFKGIEPCDQTGEYYQVEDQYGNKLDCYSDIDCIIFKCEYFKK